MLKFAIIGFGGLGKLHFGHVAEIKRKAGDVELVAICDVNENAFRTQTSTNLGENKQDLELSKYHLYTDAAELLEKEELDFVVTALPTYIHEKIAVMAMERGIHVFSEKPMALNLAQAEHMLETAREYKVKLMIGQCLRYFHDYAALKEIITSQRYGGVVRADFHRLSPLPVWSWQNWMLDEEKSGGAALDLHVHDVDFIYWAFGMPKAVTSYATNGKMKHDSIGTVYHYDGMQVTAIGEWGLPGSFTFTVGALVRFEKATVKLAADGLTVYPEEGEARKLELTPANGYVEEIVDFIACIREDKESAVNPPESSVKAIRIARAEKLSADTGKTIALELCGAQSAV